MKYVERVGHLIKQREYLHDKIAAVKNSGPLDIALVASGRNIGIDRDIAPEVREAIEQILIGKAKQHKEELQQLNDWMERQAFLGTVAIAEEDLPTIGMEPVDMIEDVTLERFKAMMRQRMMENTHKKHWGDCAVADLKVALDGNHHLTYIETDPTRAIQHYTDIANYCMMIVDNLQRIALVPQDETQGINYKMMMHVEGNVPTEKIEKIMGRYSKGVPVKHTAIEIYDADHVQQFEHDCDVCGDLVYSDNEFEEYPCCEKSSCHDALTRRLCT